MIFLSLFDGMSCLQIALRELGIIPEIYYASEIDKHAIKQTQFNFPETVQLGSVTDWKNWNIDWGKIDFIGAGSPCQGFSFAGKQLAFNDQRSKLFFVFIDIFNHCRKFNPGVKFLLENVDMKRESMRVINEFLGVFPVNINSNLVSAQNRNRWYWSNIKTKQVGLFGEIYTDIPKPIDRCILLKDILESEVEERYYLNNKTINRLINSDFFHHFRDYNEKSKCITTGELRLQNDTNYVIDMRGRGGQANAVELQKHRIRRLTPIECSRLQTIPVWYKWECSDTQQYKMLGNGWTIKVITHILSFLLPATYQ